MKPNSYSLCCCVIFLIVQVSLADSISFVRDVAPVLVSKCQNCHGPEKVKGGYRLDTFSHILTNGRNDIIPIISGDPENSELFIRLTSDDEDTLMPQDGEPLNQKQIELIRLWIKEGAKFDGESIQTPLINLLQPIKHLPAPEKYRQKIPITALEFGPKGEKLFVSGYREITVWDTKNVKLLNRLGNISERVYDLSVSADGCLLAVACGQPGKLGEVRIFDLISGQLSTVLAASTDVMLTVAFSNDTGLLAAGGADNKLRLIDVDSGEIMHVLNSHSDWIRSLAWNTDGSRVVTASRDKTAKVFDAQSGKRIASYLGHQYDVRGVVFHENGRDVLSVGDDRKIHKWNSIGPKRISDSSLSEKGIPMTIERLGNNVLVAYSDHSVQVININIKDEMIKWDGHREAVLSVAISPNKRIAASGDFDGEVILWHIDDGKIQRRFFPLPGYEK